MILPWLHPVMAPPYRYFLRHVPKATARVVICHNVVPHEPRARSPARCRGRRCVDADLLVTHAPHQRRELERSASASTPVLEAFHPRFDAPELAPAPDAETSAPPSVAGTATPTSCF